ncbi:MAG: GIY-YIG nuclease family protein [Desulfobacterales bacterium]|jgi:Uri superfamily endonuclease|nr:GIY-YIG nuclease family protein [Desulfobacterales bacterium]
MTQQMEVLKIDQTRNPDQLRLPQAKGTYVLILYASQTVDLGIGKLGIFRFASGYYAYVGSAFGPGGLVARIRHHLKLSDRPHWHIDYLRAKTQIIEIWYHTENVEHIWAEFLGLLKKAQTPVKGFGCSDCRCSSHLFHYPDKPSFRGFKTKVG